MWDREIDELIQRIDMWLDSDTGTEYYAQPLAQDWARISKVIEELGEAISEMILYTGQNPRKPQDELAYGRMLHELADVVITGIMAMQHFTKDVFTTKEVLRAKLIAIGSRVEKSQEIARDSTPGHAKTNMSFLSKRNRGMRSRKS